MVNGAAAAIAALALLASAAVAGCGDSRGPVGPGASPSAAAAASATLGSDPGTALQRQYEDVIKAVLPSVVQISTSGAQGSGVVYDDKGDIVTNAHVVGSASTVQVLTDVGGATLTAKVLGVFTPDDPAVIRVTSGAGSLRPGPGVAIASVSAGGPADAAGLRPGDVITAVEGCPIGSDSQLAALLGALAPGLQLNLTYSRSGRTHTATATLAASWAT